MKAKIFIPRHIRRQQGGWMMAALALTAVAGTASAVQTRNAGAMASNQANMQARVEGDAAKQREIERRRDLIRALSSQNAGAGAAGIETSGSFGGAVRKNINDASNDLLVSRANLSARQSALKQEGDNARAQGNFGAVTSLLDTAGTIAFAKTPKTGGK